MKNKTLNIKYHTFQSVDELDANLQILVEESKSAMNNAYSPYSKFQVGSAVLLDNGQIIKGNNQENAAYPSGLCAERVALFYSGAQFPQNKIIAIAIVANNLKVNDYNALVTPCGACRQVMVETESRQNSEMKIILSTNNGSGLIFDNVSGLMPFSFDVASLLND